MPGPPPAGVSSTVRCLSVAALRMSCASSDQMPEASALTARLTPSGPGNISGKIVRTVARHMRLEDLNVLTDDGRLAAITGVDARAGRDLPPGRQGQTHASAACPARAGARSRRVASAFYCEQFRTGRRSPPARSRSIPARFAALAIAGQHRRTPL